MHCKSTRPGFRATWSTGYLYTVFSSLTTPFFKEKNI